MPGKKLAGLLPNHTYELISAHEVNVYGQINLLVKLRETAGRRIRKDKWSPSSKYWSLPQVKMLCDWDDRGQFLVSYEDFVNQF